MRSFQILLLCLIPAIAAAGEIEIDGTYQGENLYVNNPYASSGVGFCVYEVMVNGMTTTDEINSSAFEIDLAVFRFTIGDPLEVTIRYKEGCEPAVINPEVISPRATFKTIDIALDDNILKWESSNETGSLPFFVEQYRWNKWVQVGKVQGRGNPGKHHYGMPVRLHSGENRIRVRQVDDRNVRKPELRQSYVWFPEKMIFEAAPWLYIGRSKKPAHDHNSQLNFLECLFFKWLST
jgi:hypothetical protein